MSKYDMDDINNLPVMTGYLGTMIMMFVTFMAVILPIVLIAKIVGWLI